MRQKLFVLTGILCALAVPLAAQSLFTAHVGGGFTNPLSDIGRQLDLGWNATAGLGVNPLPALGFVGEFQYNRFGLNRSAATVAGAPGGDVGIWSFTVNPVIRLNPGPENRVDPYLIGGGGVYRRQIDFTAPAIATVTVSDPEVKGGVNAGGGVTIRLGGTNTKFFAEARYHHVYTRPVATAFLPVTFGLRW